MSSQPADVPTTRTGGLPSPSGLWLPASGPRRLRAVPSASGPGLSSPRLSASDRPSSSLPDAGAASSLRLQAGSARLQLPTSARQHYRRGSGTADDGDHHSRVSAGGGSLGNGCMCCPLLPLHHDRVWCVSHLSRFLHPRSHLVRRRPVDQRKVAEEQRLHQYRPQRRCCCVHRGAPRCCTNPIHCIVLYVIVLLRLSLQHKAGVNWGTAGSRYCAPYYSSSYSTYCQPMAAMPATTAGSIALLTLTAPSRCMGWAERYLYNITSMQSGVLTHETVYTWTIVYIMCYIQTSIFLTTDMYACL